MYITPTSVIMPILFGKKRKKEKKKKETERRSIVVVIVYLSLFLSFLPLVCLDIHNIIVMTRIKW